MSPVTIVTLLYNFFLFFFYDDEAHEYWFYFQDELETLRARLDKAEKERATLKHDNEKLEARVSSHGLLCRILSSHYSSFTSLVT